MTAAPRVHDLPEEWRETESDERALLGLGRVEVRTATMVYEDDRLRERIREATGIDRTWRFFFAARVDVPGSSDSRTLRALVANRARSGFADRLRERGFERIERAERRSLRVGDGKAEATRYDAVCRLDGVGVDVEGWLTVRPDPAGARSFLLAGGGYPRSVRSASETGRADDRVRGDINGFLDPERFRSELFDLVRRVK